jgi:hypothetical protein
VGKLGCSGVSSGISKRTVQQKQRIDATMMRPPMRDNPLMTASSLKARRVRIKSSLPAQLAREEAGI